jgi:hypothetical protein
MLANIHKQNTIYVKDCKQNTVFIKDVSAPMDCVGSRNTSG